MFYAEVQNDHQQITQEEAGFREIPIIQPVDATDIRYQYEKIKADIKDLLF